MRWSFFLLCACSVLASVHSDLHMLVAVPNYIFWAQSGENLIRFFKDIDLIKQRLRQPFGERFASAPFAVDLPQLTSAVNNVIEKLKPREIYDLIAEGHPAIIQFFLGHRLNVYKNFNLLSLSPDLGNLHLIPIEELVANSLFLLPLDTLVSITLARIRTGLMKNRWDLFENLPNSFWTHPSVRFNAEVLNFYSPLGLFSLKNYETLDRHNSGVLVSHALHIYNEPVASYFNSFASPDLPVHLSTYGATRDSMVRTKLTNDIISIVFHLQAAVHVMIVESGFYLPFFKLITMYLSTIRNPVKELLVSFPGDPNLQSILQATRTCYSSVIFQKMKDSGFTYQSLLTKDLFPESCVLGDLAAIKMVLGLPAGIFAFQSLSAAQRNVIFWPMFMLLSPGCKVSSELTQYINFLAGALNDGQIDISGLNSEYGLVRNFSYIISTCTDTALPIILPLLSNQDVYAFKGLYSVVVPFLKENHRKVSFNLLIKPFFLNSSPYEEAPLQIHSSNYLDNLSSIFSTPAVDILEHFKLSRPQTTKFLPDSVAVPGYKYLDFSKLVESSSDYSIRIVLQNNIVSFNEPVPDFKFFDYALQEYYESTGWPQAVEEESKRSSFDGLRKTFGVYAPFFKPLTKFSTDTQVSETESTTLDLLREQTPQSTPQKLAIPHEIIFVQEVCEGLARMAKNPLANWQILFSDSINLSGVGPLVDTLTAFGKVISIPELRTIVYVESHRGFVPAPFLDSKVMAFLGLWVAASWRTKVTLPWQFSRLYLRFLLYDWPNNSEEATDALVNEIYAPVFEFIKNAFELMRLDEFADVNLPLEFRPHRMFSIPEPYPVGPSPFILEPAALEKSQALFRSRSTRQKLLAIGPSFYLKLVEHKMKQSLMQGRLEFQRHFRLFFSTDFKANSSFSFLSHFFVSEPISVDQLIGNIEVHCDSSLVIDNDLPSALSSVITPKDLLISSIRSFTRKELDQLLWFVRGSSNLPLGGFDKPLKFLVSPGTNLASAQTCFSIVNWQVNVKSADKSIKFLKTAMNFSSGFVENE